MTRIFLFVLLNFYNNIFLTNKGKCGKDTLIQIRSKKKQENKIYCEVIIKYQI